jgi:hypothetical protein
MVVVPARALLVLFILAALPAPATAQPPLRALQELFGARRSVAQT